MAIVDNQVLRRIHLQSCLDRVTFHAERSQWAQDAALEELAEIERTGTPMDVERARQLVQSAGLAVPNHP